MMKNNKVLWIVAVVVVAALAWFAVKNNNSTNLGGSPSPSASPSPTAKPVTSVKKSGSAATSPVAYSELVKQYEGKRIQFDMNCQAIPNSLTFKTGTNIMLDNRSGDARVITVGGTKYNLAGYGYQVVTLSSATTPKELVLGCGSAINVGKILLQANILNNL